MKVEGFDISDIDLRVGFLYKGFEPNRSRYQSLKIDFWQTSHSSIFDCGLFTSLQDALNLAVTYGVRLPEETARKMASSEKANPCGLENGLFLLRERILRVSAATTEYLTPVQTSTQSPNDKYTKMQFNWIDDIASYLNWLRFLNAKGEVILEDGRIQQPLPSSFNVSFTNGFAGLGKNFSIFLAIYSNPKVDYSAIGIALVLVGILSLGLAMANVIGLRRINTFKKR